MRGFRVPAVLVAGGLVMSLNAVAADQTQLGVGNARAEQIGSGSPLVQSAKRFLIDNAKQIEDRKLREQTLDAVFNSKTCIVHRANVTDAIKDQIIAQLEQAGLVNPADAANITGGVKAGIFPPVLKDGSACLQLPLTVDATPGSNFGGHHSYPGGLAVHESFNDQSSINFADTYRGEYGQLGVARLPVAEGLSSRPEDNFINQDIILAAPIWHDWAKMMVFQWNADGTEFTELNFGGTGTNDNAGAAGDSRTGGHHILSVAESMARGLPPAFVITQASAHSNPSLGNEFKVVNWLRAAAIVARLDPVAKGYLVQDAQGKFRLPPLLSLGEGVDLTAQGQSNLLIEYQIHNLSDADFTNSIPAVTESQVLLAQLAPAYGYDASNVTVFNNKFRNVVFAYLSPERLEILYTNGGLQAVKREIDKLQRLRLI
jgi:hypothetical protein